MWFKDVILQALFGKKGGAFMFLVSNNGKIRLNSSKSLLIRELVARFLYGGELLPVASCDSEDVRVVRRCLETVLAGRGCPGAVAVDVRDCGAGYRFLMALLAVTEGEWLLTGTPRLLERPVEPLAAALRAAGADLERAAGGWRISGRPLHADTLSIDCSLSSQFASALLLIGPKMGLRHLSVTPDAPSSEPYIAMTRYVVGEVLAGRPLRREADWSTAAFWYALLLLSPQLDTLILRDLYLDSVQGDSCTYLIFKELGISSQQTHEGVLIRKIPDADHALNLNINLNSSPDLAPVLAVAAAMLPISLTLEGLGNLNLKESRRMDALVNVLSAFARVDVQDGSALRICGMRPAESAALPRIIDTFGDHRLVMAFSLLTLRYDIQLSDVKCVGKSYPEFENYFSMGGGFGK